MLTNVSRWIARHPWRTSIGAISAVLAVLIVTGIVWGLRVSDRAERLATELRSTGLAAETAVVAADPDAIAGISDSLSVSIESARELDEDLWPLRWAGALVGWVPFIGDNVTGVPDLVERLNDDLIAAIALVDAAGVLVTAYGDLPYSDEGLVATLSGLPGEDEIGKAGRLIDDADRTLARAEGKASGMNDGRLFGRVGRESAELRTREARLRELIDWTGLATESLLALTKLGEVSLSLVGLLDSDDPAGATLRRETLSAMPELELASATAYDAVLSTNAASPSGIIGSPIGDALLDFEPVLGALADTSRAGALTWVAVSPALDVMESSPGGLIGEGSSLLVALEHLKGSRPSLVEARRILESVAPGLRSVDLKTPAAASSATTLADGSVEIARAVGFLSDFSEIGPQALGNDGPRRYLVLGQTSDELRGSGGFVSGAWLLTFDDGRMSDSEYHDIVEVDDRSKLEQYPLPPELLARHMDAPVWLLRDATWSPEFPSAARAAAEIFELGQGGPRVDGVIALTQWAIIGLGEALGSITTDSGVIGTEDLLSTLEVGTDKEGRAFLDTVFRGVLGEFSKPTVNDRLFSVALAASDNLSKKDTLVYMFDPELQSVVARSGWDGSLGRPEGDRIAVVDSNVGWSKVDRNIERSFVYDVTLRPSGPMSARLTLSYQNLSGPESGACDAQSPLHGLSYAELRQSCYWNLVRVYIPDGGSMTASLSLPIPEKSVYARVGAGLPGDDSVQIGAGPGGKYISGLLTVAPGETANARFDLLVPATALVADGDMLTYRLALTAQAGALGRDGLIRLELPPGYELAGSSRSPTLVEANAVEFALTTETDVTIEVQMRPGFATGGSGPSASYTDIREPDLQSAVPS